MIDYFGGEAGNQKSKMTAVKCTAFGGQPANSGQCQSDKEGNANKSGR